MEDKVKEFRDKNPILDFLAGFIPGVGEAQDAHDFIHAAKDKDYISMGLATAGLILPGLTGGQIKKALGLSETLIKKGWKNVDGKILSPSGEEFIRNAEGKLVSKKSLEESNKARKLSETVKKRISQKIEKQKEQINKFNQQAQDFADKTGFMSFNTEAWQSGIPKTARMTQDQLYQYITVGGPTIMRHFDTLMKNGLSENPGTYALRGPKGNYEAWFPNSLSMKGKLADKYQAGWRPVSNNEAELYLILTSPNASNKFEITGIPMYRGISKDMIDGFKKGQPQSWYSNLVENAEHYKEGPYGMGFYGAPVKTDNTVINMVRTQRAKPSSNHWNSSGKDPIIAHLSNNPNAINITETHLIDDVSVRKPQLWTVLGNNVQVKAVKGGTGMFNLSEINPLLQWSIPIGLATTIGFKSLNNEDKKR